MLFMGLVPEEEKAAYCAPYGYPADTLVYRCQTERFENLVFFRLQDYCLTVLKVIDDPADDKIFDFLVKGTLGYGEQHMALDVAFDPALDDDKLKRFGFLRDSGKRQVRLYTLGGGCAGCGHHH